MIRLSDRTEVKKIPVSAHPRAMRMDTGGMYLYVACIDGTVNRILVDGDDSAFVDNVGISTPVNDLKLSDTLSLAVVSHVVSDTISVIELDDAGVPVMNPVWVVGLLIFLGFLAACLMVPQIKVSPPAR